jgi:hypothetical protein
VLVVSTVEDVGDSLQRHLQPDDVVKIVVPVVGQGVLDWLANDERAFSRAVDQADRMATDLPGEAVEAGAGEADVALAIRDALATFPADEIVVAVAGDDDVVMSFTSDTGPTAGARRIAGVPVRIVEIAGR